MSASVHLSQHVFFFLWQWLQLFTSLSNCIPSCFLIPINMFRPSSIHHPIHSYHESFIIRVFSLRILSLPIPTWLQFHDGHAHAASLHCGLPQRRHVARQLPLDAIQDLHLQCHARTALAQHQQLARWRGWRFHLDREKGGFLSGSCRAIRLYLGRFS